MSIWDYDVDCPYCGKPQIINPFEAFAEHLMLAMRAPGGYRLFDWLTAPLLAGTVRSCGRPSVVCASAGSTPAQAIARNSGLSTLILFGMV